MTREELRSIILRSLKQVAPDSEPSQLAPGDHIRDCLGIDSFDFLQFIVSLDEQLHVNIPEQDYGKVQTLETLLDYLVGRKA